MFQNQQLICGVDEAGRGPLVALCLLLR